MVGTSQKTLVFGQSKYAHNTPNSQTASKAEKKGDTHLQKIDMMEKPPKVISHRGVPVCSRSRVNPDLAG